jgi:hypothetical protein
MENKDLIEIFPYRTMLAPWRALVTFSSQCRAREEYSFHIEI